jgi:hypothetical protein
LLLLERNSAIDAQTLALVVSVARNAARDARLCTLAATLAQPARESAKESDQQALIRVNGWRRFAVDGYLPLLHSLAHCCRLSAPNW